MIAVQLLSFVCLTIDIVDKSKDKEYEGYIECKSSLNSIASYPLIYNHEDRDAEIFTITIPDIDE